MIIYVKLNFDPGDNQIAKEKLKISIPTHDKFHLHGGFKTWASSIYI